MNEILFKMYAVRNKEGKWFRAKGYGGYGKTWIDDITKARLYARIGGARGVITWFANNHPTYGIPDLICFNIKDSEVIDETARVKKSMVNKQEKETKSKIYQLKQGLIQGSHKKLQLEQELMNMRKDLDSLTNNP